jgi:hypothetical protein
LAFRQRIFARWQKFLVRIAVRIVSLLSTILPKSLFNNPNNVSIVDFLVAGGQNAVSLESVLIASLSVKIIITSIGIGE